MEKLVHLKIFDFDETLFRVPNYTCSEAYGMTPYEWYDSSESLDVKFNVKAIGNVVDEINSESINILISHRVEECKRNMLQLLNMNNIKFDEIILLGRNTEKSEPLMRILSVIEVDRITIYEDSLWEIIKYVSFINDAKLSIPVTFMFIDKSRIIRIDISALEQLQKTAEAEKLRIL